MIISGLSHRTVSENTALWLVLYGRQGAAEGRGMEA